MQSYYYGTTTKENIKIGENATAPIFYNTQDGFTVTKSVLSAMYFAGRKVEKAKEPKPMSSIMKIVPLIACLSFAAANLAASAKGDTLVFT